MGLGNRHRNWLARRLVGFLRPEQALQQARLGCFCAIELRRQCLPLQTAEFVQ